MPSCGNSQDADEIGWKVKNRMVPGDRDGLGSSGRLCSRLCLDCVCHVLRFEYTFCFPFAFWMSYFLRCSWCVIPIWGCGVWLITVWKDDKQKIYPKRTEYTWLSVNDFLNKWREKLER